MSWIIRSALPYDIHEYKRALGKFKEQTMLKVLNERNKLDLKYKDELKRKREGGDQGMSTHKLSVAK
jgi:hypothetical protein